MDNHIERRRSNLQFAIGSARLSGFVLREEIKQQLDLCVAGSMTCEQLWENRLTRYGKSKNSLETGL